MSRYGTYKPSCINWIGQVPEHWEIKRLKEISNVETGNTPSMSNPDFYSEDGMPWIKPDNLNDFIELTDSSEKLSEKGIKEARTARKGAVLVCCIGSIGKIGVAGCSLTTNQQINSVEFYNTRVLDKYGMYLLFTSEAELIKQSNKVVVSILNKVKQSQIKYPIPTIDEQLNIANYLDDQTQKIDRLIANKKAQAEKLKELRQIEINNAVTKGLNPNAEIKDSDIDWLGKIPKHWKLRRFKYISYMKGRIGWQGLKNEEFTFNENEPFLITGMNFKDGIIRWEEVYHIPEERYNEAPEIQLMNGDVLMTKDGTIGKLLFVDTIPYPIRASLNSHLLVFRPFGKSYFPRYLYYQLQSNLFQDHIEVTKTGTTFFGITQEAVGYYKVLLPGYEEQEEIASFLDNKTNNIDRLIININDQIEKLQELRKIKIYEAVTGKIKVNAYAETTA